MTDVSDRHLSGSASGCQEHMNEPAPEDRWRMDVLECERRQSNVNQLFAHQRAVWEKVKEEIDSDVCLDLLFCIGRPNGAMAVVGFLPDFIRTRDSDSFQGGQVSKQRLHFAVGIEDVYEFRCVLSLAVFPFQMFIRKLHKVHEFKGIISPKRLVESVRLMFPNGSYESLNFLDDGFQGFFPDFVLCNFYDHDIAILFSGLFKK